jgi:hypothetical protein
MRDLRSAFEANNDAIKGIATAISEILFENIPDLQSGLSGENRLTHYSQQLSDIADISGPDAAALFANLKDTSDKVLHHDAQAKFTTKLYEAIKHELSKVKNDSRLSFSFSDSSFDEANWFHKFIMDNPLDFYVKKGGEIKTEAKSIYSIIPFRMKFSFTVLNDFSLFWGATSYGSPTARTRKSYPNQPETPYIYIENFEDLAKYAGTQEYAFDMGAYNLNIVPITKNLIGEKEAVFKSYVTTLSQSINRWIEIFERTKDQGNSDRKQAYIDQLNRLIRILTDQGIDLDEFHSTAILSPISYGLGNGVISDKSQLRSLLNDPNMVLRNYAELTYSSSDDMFHRPDDYSRDNPLCRNFPARGGYGLKGHFIQRNDGNFDFISVPFTCIRVNSNLRYWDGYSILEFKPGDFMLFYRDGMDRDLEIYSVDQKEASRIKAAKSFCIRDGLKAVETFAPIDPLQTIKTYSVEVRGAENNEPKP